MLTASFQGLLGQSAWWHPARTGALPISKMEESHRGHTALMLDRMARSIIGGYALHLETFCEEDQAELMVPMAEADNDLSWLHGTPLHRALVSDEVPLEEPRLDLCVPRGGGLVFPIATKPMALINLGTYWVSYRLEGGTPVWRWQDGPWVSSVLEDLSRHLAFEAEVLQATLDASLTIEALRSVLEPLHAYFLRLEAAPADDPELLHEAVGVEQEARRAFQDLFAGV